MPTKRYNGPKPASKRTIYMEQITLPLTEEQYNQLEREASSRKITVTEFVRLHLFQTPYSHVINAIAPASERPVEYPPTLAYNRTIDEV